MKTYESIIFNGKEHKGRILDITGWGNCLVASTLLMKKLINEEQVYFSDEAKNIEEQIFYYITPHDYKLTDDVLAKKILKSL